MSHKFGIGLKANVALRQTFCLEILAKNLQISKFLQVFVFAIKGAKNGE
jgi:hypothetical protein